LDVHLRTVLQHEIVDVLDDAGSGGGAEVHMSGTALVHDLAPLHQRAAAGAGLVVQLCEEDDPAFELTPRPCPVIW
jgi:hypothetical protein